MSSSRAPQLPRRLACALALAAAPCFPWEGGASLDLGAVGVREDLLVPLVFSGPHAGLRIQIGWDGLGARQELRSGLGLAVVSNRYGHMGASHDEEIAWLADWPWRTFLGRRTGLGTGIVSRSRVSYLWSWDDAHAYWIGSLEVPLLLSQEFSLGDGVGSGGVSVGLLTFESRPPPYYTTKQHPLKSPAFLLDRQFWGLEPVAPWNHLDLRGEARWRRRGSPWSFGLEVGLLRASHPATSFALDAGLRLTRNWGGRS